MRKKLAKIITAVTLASVVGCAVTKKVFPDKNYSLFGEDSLFKSAYSINNDVVSYLEAKNDTLSKNYQLPSSALERMLDVSTPLNSTKNTIKDYDLLFDAHSKFLGPMDSTLVDIFIQTKFHSGIPYNNTKAIEIDMSETAQALRKLPKEKFYFEHKDQFIKDSLVLIDIVNSIDLYTEVVSKELVMAMINHESHFFMFPKISWAGARGPAQVTEIGWNTVESDPYLPNVNDPRRNILAGVKIARWLENYCENNNKNWKKSSLQRKRDLIVASYNCGIGELIAYDDLKKAKERNDSIYIANRHPWYIDETPLETQNHVIKVRNTLNYILNQKVDPKKVLAYNSK